MAINVFGHCAAIVVGALTNHPTYAGTYAVRLWTWTYRENIHEL
jgi:hypothetical protein